MDVNDIWKRNGVEGVDGEMMEENEIFMKIVYKIYGIVECFWIWKL